ncbi:MAG: polymer-forming cytoskeletal protein [Bdellovibrionaceae bacterium]|nr:polymer-forming cytoskeletal protein [Pseudobdellovibrionaceae bacterium]MBX3033644.1 polymer-forming cytoskeletal protein [Pseudobdellovibrionaceae bacterium]
MEETPLETAPSHGQVTAILDRGASFEGKLTFEGTVQIGGHFKGEIFTKDTLVVSESAQVQAQIEAETIIISGRVEGNLFARRRVIMNPPAVFRGTVTSPSLKIDEGVVFEGASYMPKP